MRPIYVAILGLLGIAAFAVAGAAYLVEEARKQAEQEAKIYA
jgi:hypothetical protein